MLHKGNLLTDYERQTAASQIAMLTGVSEDFVLRNDLRVEATRFRVELMREQQVVVGRLDSRVASKPPAKKELAKGNDAGGKDGKGDTPPAKDGAGNQPGRGFRGGDPSQALLSNVFADAIKSYLPDGLGFKTEVPRLRHKAPWGYGRNDRYVDRRVMAARRA